jgi:hypothetical protein
VIDISPLWELHMQTTDDLIPRPPDVRERLARALREAKLLRRQLRVSEDAAEERHRDRQSGFTSQTTPDRKVVTT